MQPGEPRPSSASTKPRSSTRSNIQFGLGGAGTFSDGKLNTGTKNAAHRYILETLVEAGTPREILLGRLPHVA